MDHMILFGWRRGKCSECLLASRLHAANTSFITTEKLESTWRTTRTNSRLVSTSVEFWLCEALLVPAAEKRYKIV